MEHQDRSDAELLTLALAGEERAFTLLYDKLKGGIFRYAFYMTNSTAAAEEVTQEVFMSLLKEGSSYREERGDVAAFAFGITRNIVRRVRRRERVYQPLPNDEAVERLAASLVVEPMGLQRRVIRNQAVEQVRAAVASLPDHYGQVIILCDLCEFSYAETASRLACPVGTVRSRLNRAHALLARKLKPKRAAESDIRAAGTEGCLI
ncbi:MAG TPA: RNA polymerase sigma factor [Terriglobales bacterium]|jgi:RNA polymerase sigma-70 factor (ECF subfamily)